MLYVAMIAILLSSTNKRGKKMKNRAAADERGIQMGIDMQLKKQKLRKELKAQIGVIDTQEKAEFWVKEVNIIKNYSYNELRLIKLKEV